MKTTGFQHFLGIKRTTKMKKLSYEDGHIVLRSEDGNLFWNSHVIDLKDDEGGFKTILIEGKLIEKSEYRKDDRVLEL